MLNLNSIMIGTGQPQVMADFYQKVFNKPADMTEGEWHGWSVGACFFSIGAHDQVHGSSNDPSRIMFNLETTEVQAEFDRLKNLGATVIKEPYQMEEDPTGMNIATLADPDGNYFQLMSPWEGEK